MLKIWKEWAPAIVIGLILAFIINTFVFQIVHVYGASMEPNFHNNDIVFVEKWTGQWGEYEAGDVVIIDGVKVSRERSEALIKRVIGVAGDEIWVEDGDLYRNGKVIQEEYIQEEMGGRVEKITIPDGFIYAMGDNRNHSSDSRVFGPFPLDKVRGKVIFGIYPNVFEHNYSNAGIEK